MASPAPTLCVRKEELFLAYAKTVADHHRMQSAQLAAVMRGEDFPFEVEIAEAASRRENAKYAILAHQQEHGC